MLDDRHRAPRREGRQLASSARSCATSSRSARQLPCALSRRAASSTMRCVKPSIPCRPPACTAPGRHPGLRSVRQPSPASPAIRTRSRPSSNLAASDYETARTRLLDDSRQRDCAATPSICWAAHHAEADDLAAEIYRCQRIAELHRNEPDQEVRDYCAGQLERAAKLADPASSKLKQTCTGLIYLPRPSHGGDSPRTRRAGGGQETARRCRRPSLRPLCRSARSRETAWPRSS